MPPHPRNPFVDHDVRLASGETDRIPVPTELLGDDAGKNNNENACLVHIYPKAPTIGRRYPVDQEFVIIGRVESSHICNPDGSVSRSHARVELGPDGRYWVTDLESTNGTFVNNQRIKYSPLADGDYLRVGNCIYRFLKGGNVEADYHEEIYRLTIFDPLTGAHNRRALMDCIEREIKRASRYGRPLSLLMCDIDRFKGINDKLGHTAGDMTLREVANRLRGRIRNDDLLARYGGEEFAIVLPETDRANAVMCAERLRRAVCEEPFEFEQRIYKVSISVGVSSLTQSEGITPESLIELADRQLYEAKSLGRNQVRSDCYSDITKTI